MQPSRKKEGLKYKSYITKGETVNESREMSGFSSFVSDTWSACQ